MPTLNLDCDSCARIEAVIADLWRQLKDEQSGHSASFGGFETQCALLGQDARSESLDEDREESGPSHRRVPPQAEARGALGDCSIAHRRLFLERCSWSSPLEPSNPPTVDQQQI